MCCLHIRYYILGRCSERRGLPEREREQEEEDATYLYLSARGHVRRRVAARHIAIYL